MKLDRMYAHEVTASLFKGTSVSYLSRSDQITAPVSSTAPLKPMPVPSALTTSMEEIRSGVTAIILVSSETDSLTDASLLFITMTTTATITSATITMKGIKRLLSDFIFLYYRFFLLL